MKKLCLTILLVILFPLFMAGTSMAATLSVTPASSKISVGNIVSVKVVVGTSGKVINNSEGTLLFPVDLLEVVSISKNSSIFSLWVEEPKFSNFEGKITFNGGVPNPGYSGNAGEIISITFKAKKVGNASIVFTDSSVRENNGLGTDILQAKISASILIDSSAQYEAPGVIVPANSVPARPIIVSSTHPIQESWYSTNSASFNWAIPNGITSIQTSLDQTPNSIPSIAYDPSVSQRTVNNINDGVSYFHLRYQNSIGPSPVAHYKIQIDSVVPEKFTLNVKKQDVRNTVELKATDALSGIDSYSIQVDANPSIRVKKDSLVDGVYLIPVQIEGDHELAVIAYDKAGNHTESRTKFVSPAITAPVLKAGPKDAMKDEAITISGTSKYGDVDVIVSVEIPSGEVKAYQTRTLEDGSFSLVTEKFKSSGRANAWSQLVFSDKVMSPLSKKISFDVNDTKFVRATKTITYTMSAVIPLFVLLILLIYIAYQGWHKFFGLEAKIHRELEATMSDIHRAMIGFRDELGEQLTILELIKNDRELNKKEEEIFKQLRKNIDKIDESIRRQLKKIK